MSHIDELLKAAEECELVGRLAPDSATRRINRIRAASLREFVKELVAKEKDESSQQR